MAQIDEMTIKSKNLANKANKVKEANANGSGAHAEEGAVPKGDTHYYSTLTNQANNPVQVDDGEQQDAKPDIHQSLGSKKLQEEFDQNMSDLFDRINNINEQVIELSKTLNKRNNTIVNDVSQIIHEVLHDTKDVTQELNDTKMSATRN